MEKLNIAELIKDCPKGMELDSTMFDNVTFYGISNEETIVVRRESVKRKLYLDKYGCPLEYPKGDLKCVIFPKGKPTWEGFHRPFKDGDIIYNRLQKKICIYYLRGDEVPCIKGCRYNESNTQLQFETLEYPIPIVIQDYRFATEEEKARLFDAISTNGYKWNADTKTLEKATKLIFNNGDIVATISGAWIGITTGGVSREFMPTYCVINDNGKFEAYTDVKKAWCFSRLATKEERQKLFNEIKAHGYTWNSKTKTLEKLIQPQFKVGDKVHHIIDNENQIITDLIWDGDEDEVLYKTTNNFGYVYVNYLQPYKEETMEEKNNDNWAKWDLPEGYEFQDKDGNIINTSVIRLVKKQLQYPKTYEECCKILHIEPNRIIEYDDCLGYRDITQYDINLLTQLKCFRRLLICRDAYWKIAGDQMRLGKPWALPFNENQDSDPIYFIVNKLGKIYKDNANIIINNRILAFPTEEMRDAFYENFKELIELCKELL